MRLSDGVRGILRRNDYINILISLIAGGFNARHDNAMLSRYKLLSRYRGSARRERVCTVTAFGIALVSLGANACAESILQSGSPPGKASAHLDFKIVIPKVLRLDAATGALLTNARATESVLISTEAPGMRRTSVSKAGNVALRSALPSSSDGPVSYTVSMP